MNLTCGQRLERWSLRLRITEETWTTSTLRIGKREANRQAMFQSLLPFSPRPLQWWRALSLLAYEQAFSRGALAAGQKRRLLLTPNSFPSSPGSSLPHPSTPEHPRRACSQECSQATGLLQCGFFRCHATLLSTPPLWGGALRDDTKKGCGADYGFSRPDAASGWGSLFQAARYSSGELRTRK